MTMRYVFEWLICFMIGVVGVVIGYSIGDANRIGPELKAERLESEIESIRRKEIFRISGRKDLERELRVLNYKNNDQADEIWNLKAQIKSLEAALSADIVQPREK